MASRYDLRYRITDRLSWNVPWPALSYRFGDPGGVEVMPYLGLASNSWNSVTGFSLALKGDVAAQIWTAQGQRILLQAGVVLPPYKDSGAPLGLGMGDEVEPYLSAGYTWTFGHTVTLSGAAGLSRNYAAEGGSWQYESQWFRLGAGVAVRVAPQASRELVDRDARARVVRGVHGRADDRVLRSLRSCHCRVWAMKR
jgi:hypothetical protein